MHMKCSGKAKERRTKGTWNAPIRHILTPKAHERHMNGTLIAHELHMNAHAMDK